MLFCCEKLKAETKKYRPPAGGGFLSSSPNPTGQIEQEEDGSWNVNGCCGDCYVLTDLLFCPFCGAKLP